MFSFNLFVFLQLIYSADWSVHGQNESPHLVKKLAERMQEEDLVIQSMHGDNLNKYFMTGVQSSVRILSLLCMHT